MRLTKLLQKDYTQNSSEYHLKFKYKNITADAGYDISKTRKPFTGVRIVANVLTRVIASKVITAKHH